MRKMKSQTVFTGNI